MTRAAIIGPGALAIIPTSELNALQTFMSELNITELVCGAAGTGTVGRFVQFHHNHFKIHAVSPLRAQDLRTAEEKWKWIEADWVTSVQFIGGLTESDFGRRDFQTLDADYVFVLPWGKLGAGTIRETFAACKHPNVKQVFIVTSESMPGSERWIQHRMNLLNLARSVSSKFPTYLRLKESLHSIEE